MSRRTFGRLERVELRSGWRNEATDFTPWLAREENIRLLGDTLGLDLEVQKQEAQVGPFRADILCRNTTDNTLVLVENQLERTDHSHLGQLFTYAAGLDAVSVIWIASRFTEEHRAALDWLNRITHEGFHFFGLEIELWRIGDSEPAPKFNVVAKPNDWSKVVAEARSSSGELTPGQEQQIQFWSDFGTVIDELGSHRKVPKAGPSSWVGYGVGRSGFGIYPTVSVSSDWVAVRLILNNQDANAYFGLLLEDCEAIHAELGLDLEWNQKPGRKECGIEIRRSVRLGRPKERRAGIVWMLETMDALDRVFRPRIRALDASDWTPEATTDEG